MELLKSLKHIKWDVFSWGYGHCFVELMMWIQAPPDDPASFPVSIKCILWRGELNREDKLQEKFPVLLFDIWNKAAVWFFCKLIPLIVCFLTEIQFCLDWGFIVLISLSRNTSRLIWWTAHPSLYPLHTALPCLLSSSWE